MTHFDPFSSRALRIPLKDIDTDLIISAKYLTTTSKEGLGIHLFESLRERDPLFPMNLSEFQGAKIIIAGKNFGCGSSREHAAWALADSGIRAIISSEFADIFRGNTEKNGILPITLEEPIVHDLLFSGNELDEITIDLSQEKVIMKDGRFFPFRINSFTKMRFLEGISDIDYLMKSERDIRIYETWRKPYNPSIPA